MAIRTEEVTVSRRERIGADDLNADVFEWRDEDPVRVIVVPGATADLDASRPEGVAVSYTLHFPKGFSGSLRGCRVKVRGEWLSVVGDPKPYTPENCPTEWCMPVEVGETLG